MNRKFVKIVAIVLAAIMALSVGYILIAFLASGVRAAAATVSVPAAAVLQTLATALPAA